MGQVPEPVEIGKEIKEEKRIFFTPGSQSAQRELNRIQAHLCVPFFKKPRAKEKEKKRGVCKIAQRFSFPHFSSVQSIFQY
jgi:hypothetical protein